MGVSKIKYDDVFEDDLIRTLKDKFAGLRQELNSNAVNVYGYVTAYTDLPLGITDDDPEIGDLVGVNTTTGTWILNTQRRMGFYKRVALTGVAATDYGATPYAGFPNNASSAEVDLGISDTLTVTPQALLHSVTGSRVCSIQVLSGTSALSVVNGKAYIRIPSALNGMNLVMCGIQVVVKSTSGLPTVILTRGRQENPTSDFTYVSMLSTALTIDANEYDSSTATTAYVIDATKDDVLTGDIIRIDITGAGTGTLGLNLTMTFQLP